VPLDTILEMSELEFEQWSEAAIELERRIAEASK
jgi:hypothetical protein